MESFLRIIAANESMRLDQLLCKFLTLINFEESMSDPYLYVKFKAMRDQMPNISGLPFDKDLLNAFVSFKIKTSYDTEPDELKLRP